MMHPKKIIFYTIGCRTNQSETASLKNSFKEHGFLIVYNNSMADIALVNTCTVTENSDHDCRKLVNRLIRANPKINIALIGCQAQLQHTQLIEWPNVKWVIGNADKMHAALIIQKSLGNKSKQTIIKPLNTRSFSVQYPGIDKKRTRANLKVQDGCNSFCHYCIVPYARGPARSRVFADIIKEACVLAKSGYKEIVLTGINIGCYKYKNKNIADIIKELINITAIERIRISSIEPTTIPHEILTIMAQSRKLCRHLHIPIQSGDDEILKLMNRKYSTKDFTDFIIKAIHTVAGIFIGSDIIVGFPGETERHFNCTYRFLTKTPINYLHVFSYSKRNSTLGAKMPGDIPIKTIQARSRTLRKLSLDKRLNFYRDLLGSRQRVLFENKKNGYWRGFSDQYIPVLVKSDNDLSNQFKKVTLMEIINDKIIGHL